MTRAAGLLLVLLAPRPAAAVEYALSYFAVPASIEYARTDLASGAREAANDSASFGTLGLRLVLPLPGRLGPFGTAVETGFAVPAGSQAFDHRKLSTYAGSGTPFTHDQKHDGDFTSWDVAVVPLLLLARLGTPSSGVSFAAEVGAGMLAVDVSAEATESTYDSTDTAVSLKQTFRDDRMALAFAVTAAVGLVVPATESLDLRLTGGLVWMSDITYGTTEESASPVLIYGSSADAPGLTLGGLGFSVRLGLSYTL